MGTDLAGRKELIKTVLWNLEAFSGKLNSEQQRMQKKKNREKEMCLLTRSGGVHETFLHQESLLDLIAKVKSNFSKSVAFYSFVALRNV